MTKPRIVKIDRIECGRRTLDMLADFLHVPVTKVAMKDRLRKDWDMTNRDLGILEIWIEGPIDTQPGFFQDVAADVKRGDLQDEEKVTTVTSLSELIWENIPDAHKLPL